MYRPIGYGYRQGSSLYTYPDMTPIRHAFAVPFGRDGKLDIKSSWMTQGRAVHNGHEVAHCKLAGGLDHEQVLPTAEIVVPNVGLPRYTISGMFCTGKGYVEPVRYFFSDNTGLCVSLSVSSSRVWCSFELLANGRQKKPTSAPEYRMLKGVYEVTKRNPSGSWSRTPSVPPVDRKQLGDTIAALVAVYRPASWATSDWSWGATSGLTEAIAEIIWKCRFLASESQYLQRVENYKFIPPKPDFALDEPATLLGSSPITVPYGAYHLAALRQAAYLDCLDKVPKLNDNTISNILEIVQLIGSFVVSRKIEVPNSLADTWLKYRYEYGTTKMDAQEALSYIARASADLSRGFSCYGVATGKLTKSTDATVKCTMHLRQKELDYLSTLCSGLFKYGLTPNAYVIWDLVPYSFIVDWFVPVGDILHGHDMDQIYNRTFDISNIWYSLTYDRLSDTQDIMHYYTRWAESDTPNLNGFYTIETNSTTGKTVAMRILDALSLAYRR